MSFIVLLTGISSGFAAAPDKSGVKPSAISLPSGPGSIEGLGESFQPQLNTGSSSYGVAIKLPPGRAGLAPQVHMSYNSGQGNSMLGLGWSLDLKMVRRQTDKGFPGYAGTDTFVFGGEELVPLQDGTWRCENESSFSRFRQIDTDGDGAPDAWEMTEKNGTRHLMGQFHGGGGSWSAVEHPTPPANATLVMDRTYMWALDTTIDVHGNRIDYTYTLGNGVLYPATIRYSELNGNFHEVRFSYEARLDVFDDYRSTFDVQTDKRLSQIDVYSLGSLIRSYVLSYQQNNTATNLDLSLLEKVTQYDANGNYLPPLTFTYSALNIAVPALNTPSALPGLDLADQTGNVQIIDLDGDGLPDIFSTQMQGGIVGQQVCLNKGVYGASPKLQFTNVQQVSTNGTINLSQPESTLTDFDGDGLSDFVTISTNGGQKQITVYRNVAALERPAAALGFDTAHPQTLLPGANVDQSLVTFSSVYVRQMDVNFDKRSDFVTITSSFGGPQLEAIYRDGDTWKDQKFDLPPDWGAVTTNSTFNSGAETNTSVQLADMNGDRLPDLVYLQVISPNFSPSLVVHYWPYAGLGKWGVRRTMTLSVGDAFGISNIDIRDVFVQDFTGDGLADVAVIDGSGTQAKLYLRVNIAGRSWSAPVVRSSLPRYTPRDPSNPTALRFADVNGNGSTDLIFRNTGIDASWQWLDLLPDAKPNLLLSINNGLGKVTNIVYGSSTDDLIRARNAGFAWQTRCPFPNQIVRQIRSFDGLSGDTYVSEFAYRDAYYDAFEREFRGYAFAQRTDYGDDDGVTAGPAGTPTGQVNAPTLVTRYRFLTGAPDGIDNDDYGPGGPINPMVDETTPKGGREEEILKGRQVWEEKADPAVFFASGASFDQGCFLAVTSNDSATRLRMTPDDFVYTRVRQDWTIRRLYRPTDEPLASAPPGRLPLTVRDGSGHSVSFAFASTVETEFIEANGLLQAALGHPAAAKILTRKSFDYDDYGNQISEFDEGVVGGGYDDERKTTTSYALGGQALALWIIDKPIETDVTDENGAFVATTNFYYDGAPFVGGTTIESRALLHRTTRTIGGGKTINAERTQYDAFGNPSAHMDPRGFKRTIGYDASVKTFPTNETIEVGGGSPDLTMAATYDVGFAVMTSSTDFNSNNTAYTYDGFGRLVRIIKPGDTFAEPTMQYEYQMGDPITSTLYSYDASGALTVSGGGGALISSRIVTRQKNQAGAYTTATYVDGFSRNVAAAGNGDTVDSWIVSKLTRYSKRQTVKSETTPYATAGSANAIPQYGALVSGSEGQFDHYYDAVGREIVTYNPPETTGAAARTNKATQYLPLEKRMLDENDTNSNSQFFGTPMVQREDGLGRLVQVGEVVKLTDSGEAGGLTEWTTRYAYDLNDKLTQIVDSQGNTKTMQYDGLGRMLTMLDPDRGRMTYVYDDSSNITDTTDAKTQQIHYTYDGANRLLTEDYLDDASAEFSYGRNPEVSYIYDVAPGAVDGGDGTTLTPANTMGFLTRVQDTSGEEWFSYDERGRVVAQTKRITDPLNGVLVSYTTGFGYDSADKVTSISYPDGDSVQHFYNSRSLLSRINGAVSGDIIGSVTYQPSGQQAAIAYGNGVQTNYGYDPRLRLNSLVTNPPGGGDAFINYGYTFDGVSNITRINDNRAGIPQGDPRQNTQVFGYDDLYRLIRAAYPKAYNGISGSINYRYDRIGNMVSMTSDIPHEEKGLSVTNLGQMSYGSARGDIGRRDGVAPGPHALTGTSDGSHADRLYGYDGNGNMKTIDGLTCTWDFKDRLVKVENSDMVAFYSYDYTDRRVSKVVFSKGGSGVSPLSDPLFTQYPSKYFETRDYDVPVKYVWNGETRVARVTGSLGSNTRIQRMRLTAGWNLVSTCVNTQISSITGSSLVQTACHWDPVGKQYVPLSGTGALSAGAMLWIRGKSAGTVPLRGSYTGSSTLSVAIGSQYIANAGYDDIKLAFTRGVTFWQYHPASGTWQAAVMSGTTRVSSTDSSLRPGRPLFLTASQQQTIAGPDTPLRVTYYHQDHLGSTNVVSTSTGATASESNAYAFGGTRNNAGSIPSYYGFLARERDPESTLTLLDARYLAASLGRFTRFDPLIPQLDPQRCAFPQRLNPYAYASNRPISYSDPTGLVDWSTVGSGLVKMAAGTVTAVLGVGAASGGTLIAITGVAAPVGAPAAIIGGMAAAGGIATTGVGFAQVVHGLASNPNSTADKKVNETINHATEVIGKATTPGGAAGATTEVFARAAGASEKTARHLGHAAEFATDFGSAVHGMHEASKELKTLNGTKEMATSMYEAGKAVATQAPYVSESNSAPPAWNSGGMSDGKK